MQSFKTYFNWSTGKDSAMALYQLLQDKQYKVDCLVTTVNSHYNRVSMHGLRTELLKRQCDALELPYTQIDLPETPSMEQYEALMIREITALKSQGFTHSAFGDIFLEDLRDYREKQLSKMHITPVFPLWKKDTAQLMSQFLKLGFKAVIVCAHAKYFNEDFVGREVNQQLIDSLPGNVDPCGENGEFHTFCYDGPIFKQAVAFNKGITVYREYPNPDNQGKGNKEGFWYCDLY